MSLTSTRLIGTTLLAIFAVSYGVVRGNEDNQQASEEATKKAAELVKKKFPVLANPAVPPPVYIAEKCLAHAFPGHRFFALVFRQYPVARIAPQPLGSQNLFVVDKDGKVRHLKDAKALEKFFRARLRPVADEQAARYDVEAWLRLSEEFKQDGFFKFSIPKDSLIAEKSKAGWQVSGKATVTQGGKGEIRVAFAFTERGKLAGINEMNSVKPGVRPICQATKLLDPDPVVRQMAEKDILVMGQAAKEYLHEQRAQASPQLKQAIDRIWQRIIREGW
jgi:hypothetical protein